MSLLSLASGASAARGYAYFMQHKVLHLEETEPNVFDSIVQGSGDQSYHVTIQLEHPRRSHCDCPHAAGRQIICKHMVAAYFTAFPLEAEAYLHDMEHAQEEAEAQREAMEKQLVQYVHRMKKSALQETLLDLLSSGPEWQYDRFLDRYVLDPYDTD